MMLMMTPPILMITFTIQGKYRKIHLTCVHHLGKNCFWIQQLLTNSFTRTNRIEKRKVPPTVSLPESLLVMLTSPTLSDASSVMSVGEDVSPPSFSLFFNTLGLITVLTWCIKSVLLLGWLPLFMFLFNIISFRAISATFLPEIIPETFPIILLVNQLFLRNKSNLEQKFAPVLYKLSSCWWNCLGSPRFQMFCEPQAWLRWSKKPCSNQSLWRQTQL